jgi:hypothetical protein
MDLQVGDKFVVLMNEAFPRVIMTGVSKHHGPMGNFHALAHHTKTGFLQMKFMS